MVYGSIDAMARSIRGIQAGQWMEGMFIIEMSALAKTRLSLSSFWGGRAPTDVTGGVFQECILVPAK